MGGRTPLLAAWWAECTWQYMWQRATPAWVPLPGLYAMASACGMEHLIKNFPMKWWMAKICYMCFMWRKKRKREKGIKLETWLQSRPIRSCRSYEAGFFYQELHQIQNTKQTKCPHNDVDKPGRNCITVQLPASFNVFLYSLPLSLPFSQKSSSVDTHLQTCLKWFCYVCFMTQTLWVWNSFPGAAVLTGNKEREKISYLKAFKVCHYWK